MRKKFAAICAAVAISATSLVAISPVTEAQANPPASSRCEYKRGSHGTRQYVIWTCWALSSKKMMRAIAYCDRYRSSQYRLARGPWVGKGQPSKAYCGDMYDVGMRGHIAQIVNR